MPVKLSNPDLTLFDYFYSSFLFFGSVCLSPLLFSTIVAARICHYVWFSCIALVHPNIDFVKETTVRTLLDTHRNQGIIAVLLAIRGPAEPDAIRRHLQEVINRRDKAGKIAFPRLRQCLVARWGCYAWERNTFDLDQNLVLAPATYRGRPVSETNIQNYVSEVTSKYLPNGVPPWQLVIIPFGEDQHFLLLRLHHVLLCENLNIADLLPLVPPTRHNSESFEDRSPLVEVFKQPQSIPYLKERLQEEFTNRWNEFISNYDPLENPELLKSTPTISQFLAAMLITSVSICKEYSKGYKMVKKDIFSKLKYFNSTVSRECTKRQITAWNFVKSVIVSLDPRNIMKVIFFSWYWSITAVFVVPVLIYREMIALHSCISLNYCGDSHSFVGFCYHYVPLFYYAAKEVLAFLCLLVQAPKTLLDQMFPDTEILQTIPPCGRKVVAWSEPVSTEFIKEISKRTGVSETEILLATVSPTISRYCFQAGITTPKAVSITARNINSNYILASGTNVKPEDSVSGLLCLKLPILNTEKEETFMENLQVVKQNFAQAVSNQQFIFLLTILQTRFGVMTKVLPTSFVGVFLKYLSRVYTIGVTELTSMYPKTTQRTMWGQEVTNIIYWRPPQANMSISLCFNQYADSVRLGVMCDAQVLPNHHILATEFPDHINDLAEAAGVI